MALAVRPESAKRKPRKARQKEHARWGGSGRQAWLTFQNACDANKAPLACERNATEILDGLKVGDKVILSDMSAWDAFDRIRLK